MNLQTSESYSWRAVSDRFPPENASCGSEGKVAKITMPILRLTVRGEGGQPPYPDLIMSVYKMVRYAKIYQLIQNIFIEFLQPGPESAAYEGQWVGTVNILPICTFSGHIYEIYFQRRCRISKRVQQI